MEFVKCSKGHYYDPNVTSFCPQCAAEAQSGSAVGDYGATMPVGAGGDYGATVPVGTGADYGDPGPMRMAGDYGATEPIGYGGASFPGGGNVGPTMPTTDGGGFLTGDFGPGSKVENYDDVTMPTIVGGIAGFTPVVGWLVCTDGPAKGADYRIRAGYNYMGRAEHMDICITGDKQIGRERHAMIAYDQEEKVFFFGPADGKSIVRLNGKMVMVPSKIHAYDIITLGTTKLIFIPLCGERFNWDE